jgi:hypothetical protein
VQVGKRKGRLEERLREDLDEDGRNCEGRYRTC